MTSYADLAPFSGENLVAIGWLSAAEPYAVGDVDAAFVEKLVELAVNPWQPARAMGRHRCEFCRLSGGPATFSRNGSTAQLGVSNVFVPVGAICFVAPSLILHYIDAHSYAPPDVFVAAVRACPPMRSLEYLRALSAAGVKPG